MIGYLSNIWAFCCYGQNAETSTV